MPDVISLNPGLLIFLGMGALFGLVITLSLLGYQSVPQGQEYMVERFGKYTRTLYPGIRLIIPIADQISHRINMKEQVMDVPSQKVITVDNAMVTVDGVVFFQVMDSAKAAYRVENLNSAIENLTTTNIRTVMGSMELDALLSKRDDINAHLMRAVDEATDAWGVKILRVEIKDILPPQDLIDAMASQMKAERNKRAYILEAEGKRQASILTAEGDAQSKVIEAKGLKEATFLEAIAQERLAEAEAKATEILSKAIDTGDVHTINYFIAQKYIEALGKIASADNQKLIMMPLEASNVLGALGGIGEVIKEAFAQIPQKQPTSSTQVLEKTETVSRNIGASNSEKKERDEEN